MKQILRQLLIIVCGWVFTNQAFAANPIKTIVKGSVEGFEVRKLKIFKRGTINASMVSDSVKSNGQFQFVMNVKEPGFYVVSTESNKLIELELYLIPGDQLSMKIGKDQIVMTGKGSELNQFLYDLSKAPQTYADQLAAINNASHATIIRNRALLLGNAQGAYLNKVFGPVLDSKIHASDTGMVTVNFADLNIRLLPEIMVYPNWREMITELMFARMKAGQLKIRKANSWIADFGNAIENQKLKEAYVTAMLTNSVSMGDLTAIQTEIKEALPLIKNPANLAKINGLKGKIAMGMNFYKNALPGTDMSRFTFENAKAEQVSIQDYKGKLIFVDLWNTGCKPCIAEMPYLKHLEHELQGKDIVFLSISCDYNIESWKRFLQKRNMTGEQLIITAKKDTFFNKIGKGGIPRFVILDKEGKMIDYNSCKRPSNPVLKIYLTELLNQSQS